MTSEDTGRLREALTEVQLIQNEVIRVGQRVDNLERAIKALLVSLDTVGQ